MNIVVLTEVLIPENKVQSIVVANGSDHLDDLFSFRYVGFVQHGIPSFLLV